MMSNLLKNPKALPKHQATAEPKTVWRLVRSCANDNTPPVSYWLIRLSIIGILIALLFVFLN